MTDKQEKAIAIIEAQQAKEKGRTPAWMVGEQLKDICRAEPDSAELIVQDMETASMHIQAAEKKIKKYADGHKTGNFACVTPAEAEDILRKFYGLPSPALRAASTEEVKPIFSGPSAEATVNLEDFL